MRGVASAAKVKAVATSHVPVRVAVITWELHGLTGGPAFFLARKAAGEEAHVVVVHLLVSKNGTIISDGATLMVLQEPVGVLHGDRVGIGHDVLEEVDPVVNGQASLPKRVNLFSREVIEFPSFKEDAARGNAEPGIDCFKAVKNAQAEVGE